MRKKLDDKNMFSFVFYLFVILVISRFDFEGWIWVLIASVPDFCILFTFINDNARNHSKKMLEERSE